MADWSHLLGNDEGSNEILKTMLANPVGAAVIIIGLGGAVAVSAMAYSSVTQRLEEHNTAITDIRAKIDTVDRRSSDKLDRLVSDINDVKVQMRGLSSSMDYLVRQRSGTTGTP